MRPRDDTVVWSLTWIESFRTLGHILSKYRSKINLHWVIILPWKSSISNSCPGRLLEGGGGAYWIILGFWWALIGGGAYWREVAYWREGAYEKRKYDIYAWPGNCKWRCERDTVNRYINRNLHHMLSHVIFFTWQLSLYFENIRWLLSQSVAKTDIPGSS